MAKEIKEKRKFPRIKVYHLAKYQVVSGADDKGKIPAFVYDIGAGGVCMRSHEQLPVSCVIRLWVNFPHLSEPLTGVAKIVWARRFKHHNFYESGLEFSELDSNFREAIAKQVELVRGAVKKEGGPDS